MAKTVKVEAEAADKKEGMTLGELDGFVQEAVESGLLTGNTVFVRTGFRNQIQYLRVPK
jgi:hypothetical protein